MNKMNGREENLLSERFSSDLKLEIKIEARRGFYISKIQATVRINNAKRNNK